MDTEDLGLAMREGYASDERKRLADRVAHLEAEVADQRRQIAYLMNRANGMSHGEATLTARQEGERVNVFVPFS